MPEFPATPLPPPGLNQTGLFLPKDWGAGWRVARAASGSRLVNVGCWGTSISQGFDASNFITKSWFGLVVAALQNVYGNGGGGYDTLSNTNWAAWAPSASGSGGTGPGGWNKGGNPGSSGGPGGYFLANAVASSGVTLTWPARNGTAIDIYWLPQSPASQDFTWAVDGGGATTVHTGGATTGTFGKTSITGLSPGTHSLVLAATAGQPILHGALWRNATGILPWNLSTTGRTASDGTRAPIAGYNAANNDAVTNLTNMAAFDLLFFELGVNDAATSLTATTYSANLRRHLDAAKAGNSACDIVIIGSHQGTDTDTTFVYQDMLRDARLIAEDYGAAMVNFWALGRNSWSYWNGLGYWGNGTNNGASGTDTLHESDTGHQYMATQVMGLLPGLLN